MKNTDEKRVLPNETRCFDAKLHPPPPQKGAIMKTALYFFTPNHPKHTSNLYFLRQLPNTHIQSLFFTPTAQYTHPIPTHYIVLTVILLNLRPRKKLGFSTLR